MSLKMQVISKVVIEPISEEFMKELIIAEISKQNPDVNVNNIEFKVSRNPTRVEAIVDAQYGASAPASEVTTGPSESTESTVDNVAEAEDDSGFLVDAEMHEPKTETTEPETVNSIFN